MRPLVFCFLLLLTFGCSVTKGHKMVPDELKGTWVPVSMEVGGNQIPKIALEHQTMVLSDSSYTVTAESVDKGIVKYHKGKMDIYGRQGVNAGKHYPAIYKYENGQLTICYNLAGDHYPESFKTTGKQMYLLSVFRKPGDK